MQNGRKKNIVRRGISSKDNYLYCVWEMSQYG